MRKNLFALILALASPLVALGADFDTTTTPVSPRGVRATIDLPANMHQRNTGGIDGLGLCVFTSSEVAGWGWQNLEELHGFQKWMESQPGGGWPAKFDQMLSQYCAEKGVPVPKYVQHIGGDTGFLDLCLKTRRAPCLTYAGMDGFYEEDIAHMVVLGHFDELDSCILDNNRPGRWIWQSRDSIIKRWHINTAGQGWAFVFLTTPPPPVEDGVAPGPKPKPKPIRPRKPLFPRWSKLVLSDGEVIHKLFDGDKFLGVWKTDGWHPAVEGTDGWTIEPNGVCPDNPPGYVDRYFTNGGEEVGSDYFQDDSGKPYLTVVVKDDAAKKKTLKELVSHYRGRELDKVHLNVFVESWWAAGNVKHKITAQKAGETKASFGSDDVTVDNVWKAMDSLFPPEVAPAPRSKPEVTPETPENPPVPPVSPDHVLVPSWAFWGTVGTLIFGVYHVCKR